MVANPRFREAFETVAQHLCNLDEISGVVTRIESETDSLEDAVRELEVLLEETEMTLRTDIRILINECRHMMNRKTTR